MAKLWFKQLLAGRDFGRSNPVAAQMQNFTYLIGDEDSHECVVVDPAWAVDDLVKYVQNQGFTLTGALATHYHPDHVGGDLWGFQVQGLSQLMALSPCKVHAHKLEIPGIRQVTGLDLGDFVQHDSGDKVRVGDIDIELLHTPGHTPGSLCFRLKSALVAGDTLFLQGCGRVDLPGGDVDEMYRTLTTRLSTLPDDVVLYPGHAYSGEYADMKTVRRINHYLRVPDVQTWRRMMGR